MAQIPSRLEFPTESYDDFVKGGQLKGCCLELYFYYMFLLRISRVFLNVLGYIKSCILLFYKQKRYKSV
jgi:hypothetical protein